MVMVAIIEVCKCYTRLQGNKKVSLGVQGRRSLVSFFLSVP